MQQADAPRRISETARAIGEKEHQERGRQGEARPSRDASPNPAPHQPDGEAGLARRRAGEKLRQRDEIDVGAFAEPPPALDELGAKIAEMGDRPAERGEAKPEESKKDLA